MENPDGQEGGGNQRGPRGVPEMDRLPPPAFPPGIRRGTSFRPAERKETAGKDDSAGFPPGAMISPDEPIRRIGEGFPAGAFISPDDPIRSPEGSESPQEEEGGEVTGMGGADPDTYRKVSRPAPGPRDPEEIAAVLEELAAGLRAHGTAALTAPSNLSPFESGLRGYLGGYLVSRRRDSG